MAMRIEDSETEGGATDPMDAGTECIYCGLLVNRGAMDAVPAVDDDATWKQRATEHAADCEWIATRAHRLDAVSDEQIRALRDEAATAGDYAQVSLCERALGGEGDARAVCADAIRDARAQ